MRLSSVSEQAQDDEFFHEKCADVYQRSIANSM